MNPFAESRPRLPFTVKMVTFDDDDNGEVIHIDLRAVDEGEATYIANSKVDGIVTGIMRRD